jgi:hypothetical protein
VVASDASGAWAGQGDKIAAFQDGAWAFYAPQEGWIAWVRNENILIVYAASGWAPMPGGGGDGGGVTDHGMLTGLADDDHLQYLTNARGDARYTPVDPATLGVNATADTTNRLAVSSAASLFNHEGSGHQIKVNKNAAADTASLLFQNGFSGRAEMGLAGDDDFHFKVSPDGSAWFDSIRIDRATGKVSFPAMGASREVLAADRTYYVRTDGDDDNDGLSNTSGGAFLTLQQALDVCATIDFNGFTVTIKLAGGTYTAGATIPVCVGQAAASNLIIDGNASSPGDVIVSTTSASVISAAGAGARVRVQNMELRTATAGYCLSATNGGYIEWSNIRFGACAQAHILATNSGGCRCAGNYAIVGNAQNHFVVQNGFIECNGLACTLTGTPVFQYGFVSSSTNGIVRSFGMTWTGSATGARYGVTTGGGIQTFGAGANYFPGNSAGAATAPGWYA